MLELAEIFMQQQIPAATQMYEQYVRTVGQKIRVHAHFGLV